jgi:hypothetical protein
MNASKLGSSSDCSINPSLDTLHVRTGATVARGCTQVSRSTPATPGGRIPDFHLIAAAGYSEPVETRRSPWRFAATPVAGLPDTQLLVAGGVRRFVAGRHQRPVADLR